MSEYSGDASHQAIRFRLIKLVGGEMSIDDEPRESIDERGGGQRYHLRVSGI